LEPTTGEYVSLVVSLGPAADGRWCLTVTQPGAPAAYPLVPATFVIRLWRAADTGILRGVVRLRGSDLEAAVQGNANLALLVATWLAGGGESANRPPVE
jgi:hypothetical protein